MKRRTWQHGCVEIRRDAFLRVIRSVWLCRRSDRGLAEGAGDPLEPLPTSGMDRSIVWSPTRI